MLCVDVQYFVFVPVQVFGHRPESGREKTSGKAVLAADSIFASQTADRRQRCAKTLLHRDVVGDFLKIYQKLLKAS